MVQFPEGLSRRFCPQKLAICLELFISPDGYLNFVCTPAQLRFEQIYQAVDMLFHVHQPVDLLFAVGQEITLLQAKELKKAKI